MHKRVKRLDLSSIGMVGMVILRFKGLLKKPSTKSIGMVGKLQGQIQIRFQIQILPAQEQEQKAD
jgi:hypothetical protein